MVVELHNPEGLPQPEFYRQVAVASGSRTVYLAGQVARNRRRRAGRRRGPRGPGRAGIRSTSGPELAAVGGSFDDVAKLTLYVVDWNADKLPQLGEGVARAAQRLGVDPIKPVTLISVAELGEPDLLVEVDAVAVLD